MGRSVTQRRDRSSASPGVVDRLLHVLISDMWDRPRVRLPAYTVKSATLIGIVVEPECPEADRTLIYTHRAMHGPQRQREASAFCVGWPHAAGVEESLVHAFYARTQT